MSEDVQQLEAGGTAATELSVGGMSCGNCARRVTEAIQGVPGVRSATVMLESGRASVRWDAAARPDLEAVLASIRGAGYEGTPVAAGAGDHGDCRKSGWQWNLVLGGAVTVALMAGEWVFGLAMTPWFQWLAFALAGGVQAIAGARFYRGAWAQLRIGSSNMDTLVALGSSTAFGYSAWALLSGAGGHVYFMEAAAIITVVSAGHWLEARVGAKASSTLRGLLHLAPEMARRRDSGGAEADVPVGALRSGDLIVLRPGDRVPVDGVAIEGDSAVDEAMLTGESTPVDKAGGSELFAGTSVLNGRLLMRVTATGEGTALARIIAAVQRAQSSRANIQRLGDRVSAVFVPAVVLVAIAAGLWWGLAGETARSAHELLSPFLWRAHPPSGSPASAFVIAAAVLIVACPCAMGLATPAAIMAAANAAARRGILIRDGVALEKAGRVATVVFDKTGTLTEGRPEVAQTWWAGPRADDLAASLARSSSHPISHAVARISSGDVGLSGWQEVRGAGVEAGIAGSQSGGADDGGRARLGSPAWLREKGVDTAPGEAFIEEWSGRGATIVGVAVGRELRGLVAVRDALKPGARDVIGRLRRQGILTCLVTGDNRRTAASIAEQIGIAAENVFAEVRPERKADLVTELKGPGGGVAFVGDGINDAPALEQADLGIAVSRASDIARDSADIILLKSDIGAVPESLELARATLRTIKQNLFWAFFYNALGVPLAALGFMSPVLCAAAMGASDLIVIGNALLLLARKSRQ